MTHNNQQVISQANTFNLEIKERSDNLMNYFLIIHFAIGIGLAFFYNTWLIAFGVGGIVLLAYYSVKILLPNSSLYQYVLSAGLGVFMAQFIFQMHGLFEMHFFAFIASAILITYQKWQLQIPLLIVIFIHHALFDYLQTIGYHGVFFTQLSNLDLQTFIVHILLTVAIFFICGLWAYQLKKYNEINIAQTLRLAQLEKEAQFSEERKQHAEMLAEINQNLEKQTKELEFSNAALEQFAYLASHDLQEPLRTVSAFMTQVDKKYGNVIDDRGKKYIRLAIDGAQRMRVIIRDLLEFSKIGQGEDKREEVNLQLVVTEITNLYQKMIKEQKAKIVFSNLPVLQTFKAPIMQVFQNLIANGLKYQLPGNVPVVSIQSDEQSTHWLFSIKDNGIGISEKNFSKIFVIFKRLHTDEDYPGTGMGLAVTKKTIENLGGKIWLTSEEGKGSTFYFTIPK